MGPPGALDGGRHATADGAPRIELTSTSPAVPVRDSFGNVLGGIRLSEHAVPIAVNDGVNSGPGFCILYGSHIDFSVATLAALYPKHATYVSAVKAVTKQTVKDRFILAEDAQSTTDQADRSFIGYGNSCGPECRATQTLRVLTDGSLIPNADKLLRSLERPWSRWRAVTDRPRRASRRKTMAGR